MKLLIIGFDAVGWSSIHSTPEKYFQCLMKKHVHGPLISTKVAHTLPAMFCVYEGVDRSDDWRAAPPKGHKGYHFTWNTSWHAAKRPLIFDMLMDAGVTMGLVSLPVSAPVKPYREFVLGSWMRDVKTRKQGSRELYFPKSIKETVPSHRGCILRELGPNKYIGFIRNPGKALKISAELAALRMDNFIKLNDRFNVDLGFLYFDFADRIAHLIPPSSPVLDRVMTLSDNLLREVVEATKPDHILVFSDHGWSFRGVKIFCHDHMGFYIYTGRRGGRIGARIVDVAPTILNEFHVPVPRYFEGKTL